MLPGSSLAALHASGPWWHSLSLTLWASQAMDSDGSKAISWHEFAAHFGVDASTMRAPEA